MRNISSEIIDLFNNDYRQIVRVHFSKGEEHFDITEADILQGGLTIDRYSVSARKIEIGSAIASELTMKLRNYDGKFDDVSFEGALLDVEVGIKKWDANEWENAQTYWVPCGQFVVDTPPRTLATISISALDKMVLFDKPFDRYALKFPAHVDSLVEQICGICGVELQTNLSNLPNHQYSVGGLPTSGSAQLTYRQLLRWCAAITGTCAYINAEGQLVMSWYEQRDYTFGPSERYSGDMLENDITITGFIFKVGENESYVSGTSDYTLDLSDCGILTNTYQGVLDELCKARADFHYRPYEAVVKSAPYLFPMDMIHYKDKTGDIHDTIVTHVTFTLNQNTSISGSGETTTNNSYSLTSEGMTASQAQCNRKFEQKLEDVESKTNDNEETFNNFKEQYSSDIDFTRKQIESLVTKEVYQQNTDETAQRIQKAETAITQNADAIQLRATKDEVSSMITFTEKDGLVITHDALAGKKVKISADGIEIINDSSAKVTINATEISIANGDSACVVTKDGLSFRGIRNKQELWVSDGTIEMDDYSIQLNQTILATYSYFLILYRTNVGGIWGNDPGVMTGSESIIVPLNGLKLTMTTSWNTLCIRSVVVANGSLAFGPGYHRVVNYSISDKSNVLDLSKPSRTAWKVDSQVCVPYKIYGFM
nr:MAG TPA: protein of unknown function (DUF5047) [Caudoviricetes sp.]